MPAITDRAVWEKVTKGLAGIRWDSVAERVSKHIGGNQEEIRSAQGEVREAQHRSQRNYRKREEASVKK